MENTENMKNQINLLSQLQEMVLTRDERHHAGDYDHLDSLNDSIDALMIGVLPQYQGKGASLLIFKYLLDSCHKYGITRMYANPQLETNHKVQSIFDDLMETHEFQRRRSYVKTL